MGAMDFVSPILEAVGCLWGCVSVHIAKAGGLENNLNSLRCATEELRDLSEDVKKRIELAEQQQVVRTRRLVEGWLQRAEMVEQEASQVLQRGEQEVQSKCFWGQCPRNYCSRFKVGGKVEKMVARVKEERSKGYFEVVADELPYVVVEERPLENTVGLDLIFLEAWRCINDENTGILGLYGLGGVGKTTLLTKINNEFTNHRHDFKMVIWVAMVKQATVEDVQELIYNRVNLKDLNWHRKGQDEKAVVIYNFLKGKKFVLLLDDIREQLDLSRVGIPLPSHRRNRGKVVFTTRSQEVCSQMEAQMRIKVTCLAQGEAKTLFNAKVGEETLNSHPEIRQLAQTIAEECGGLPLALIIIGRAMSGKEDPREWRRAIQVLRESPSKFSGMRDYVFPVLRFSYDSLNDETIKQCFLYCSIFPEDYDIQKENLVEQWIGEGLINESTDINEARNEGFDIIEVLKRACLLETGKSGDHVKMHDVIRDMAIWIACGDGNQWRNKIVVEQHIDSIAETRVAKWAEAHRIAVFGSSTIHGSPACPDLLTLLIRDCNFAKFPSPLFQNMPTIRVLDLSNNSELFELPVEIMSLVTLQYFDLSSTKIVKLPPEFRYLTQLRHLLLNYTKDLTLIPREVIASFPHLRVLSMNCSCSDDCLDEIIEDNVLSGGRESLLDELEQLKKLQDLCLTLTTMNSVTKLLSSERLSRSARHLCLKRCSGMTEITIPFSFIEQMVNLERIEIRNCRTVNLISIQGGCQIQNANGFRSLSSVTITDCQMVEMNWLMHVPALESLHLQACKLLEVVLSDSPMLADYEIQQRVFSKLTTITLFDLPMLKTLCPRALAFPCLEQMTVTLCPSLRKLPFDMGTARSRLKVIRGWPSWWDHLEWEDDAIEPVFRPYFTTKFFRIDK